MIDYPTGPPAPQQVMRHAESNTSQVTACHRCRKQKLRCSREIPSCKRCQDISATCTYPPPPDRKLLAAQRAQNAKARSLQESRNATEQYDFSGVKPANAPKETLPTDIASSQVSRTPRTDHDRRSLSGESQGFSPSPLALLQVTFPSEELALALIDIYFSHQYNSTLLFHKPTLAKDYLAGKIPDYVALSVFALGAVFLAVSNIQNIDISNTTVGSQRPGEDWARAASQKALMHCDQPRYETVQACQTLAMYWFANGQTDRTHMHHHIAYRTCCLLGYNSPSVTASMDVFSAELKRRAFWASWSMSCLSQNNTTFKAKSWREAVGLPLPCDEASFAACQPVSKEAFDAEGHFMFLTDYQPELARASYMSEIVKLLSVWWEISTTTKKFVEAGSMDTLKTMSQLQDLDQQLELVRENLHPSFQYKDITSFASLEVSHSYQLFAVRVLYHLCVCTLHSSIVPVFSNIPPDPRISRKLTHMSADEAVIHSQALISLATDLLGVHSDRSRCPSFTGYAMFMAVSIQFKALVAQGLLRHDGIGALYPAISILEYVKGVWRTQEALWKTLESLFQRAGININNLPDTRQLSTVPDRNPNLDQIAAHGILEGNAGMYTYVPDEEPPSGSSRQTSSSVSRGSSPNVQSTISFRRPPTHIRSEENYRPSMAASAPLDMPSHAEQSNPHMYWSGAQTQIYNANQGANSSQHDSMLRQNTPFQYRPPNLDSQHLQRVDTASEENFQNQESGMGYMGVDISMGIDNMDLDTTGVNLWWDQPFEAISADQHRWWHAAGGY